VTNAAKHARLGRYDHRRSRHRRPPCCASRSGTTAAAADFTRGTGLGRVGPGRGARRPDLRRQPARGEATLRAELRSLPPAAASPTGDLPAARQPPAAPLRRPTAESHRRTPAEAADHSSTCSP
jgi:hypothetical protein